MLPCRASQRLVFPAQVSFSEPLQATPERAAARACAALLLALLAVKAAWLLADPALRFFMGDSASYLHAALTGWTPQDRSFTYPLLVRFTALATGSAWALLLAKAAMGVLVALALFALLRLAGATPGWSAAAALMLAVEPAQLFYERMLMAEGAGLLALVAMVLALARYAHDGRLRWLPAAAVAGIAAISLRFAFLPLVLGLTACLPLLVLLRHPRERRRAAGHVAVALLATVVLHGPYAAVDGRLTARPPGYLPAAGMMRVGLVAPLVKPAHFEGTGVDAAILGDVSPRLADPRLREAQVWGESGLWAAIVRHSPDPERVARTVTLRALRDDPAGLLRLGAGTLADYFDPAIVSARLQDELGVRPPPASMLDVLQARFGYDARGLAARPSPAWHWFSAGAPWLVGCLFALPLLASAVLAANWRSPRRGVVLVLWLASMGLAASHALFSHIPSLRYLHPFPWFVLANAALLADARWRRIRARAAPGTPASSSRAARA